MTSNVLMLEIQSTPPQWAAAQLAASLEILNQPLVPAGSWGSAAAREARAKAGAVLRFLDTREAAGELVRLWLKERPPTSVDRSPRFRLNDSLADPPEYRDVELGVHSSPYIDATGQLIPAP